MFWFLDFWNFILDFLLQWSFSIGTTMDHSIHWYYCFCWLPHPSGHLKNIWTFWDFEKVLIFELQLLKFHFGFSSSMIIQYGYYYGSFNTLILLLLLTLWFLWTLRKFRKILWLVKFYFQFSSMVIQYYGSFDVAHIWRGTHTAWHTYGVAHIRRGT